MGASVLSYCRFCQGEGVIPYVNVATGDPLPCLDCMVCCGCGERFPHEELTTLGGGGPFCGPCADRIDLQMNDPAWWAANGPKE